MSNFDASVIDAVTGHMNGDHPEDNLLIVRAFGFPKATESAMTGLDSAAGIWRVVDEQGEHELRVEWPGGSIDERPQIRREVVSLYKAACARLGVPPREEHTEVAANGDKNHHGHSSSGSAESSAGGSHGAAEQPGRPYSKPEDDGSFAYAIRTATWGDHEDSETSTVMEDIMRMRASIDLYTQLVVQHYYMYEALEEVSKQISADPRFAKLHPAALIREQALIEDLEFLLGENWRDKISPVAATRDYVARMREVAADGWLPGIIAHHYTRYLGDLSGGQMIAKRVKRQHELDRAGIAFYDFADLGDLAEFKQLYRESLNELGETLDEEERKRMIDEVRLAYRFNSRVFVDMERAEGERTAEKAVTS